MGAPMIYSIGLKLKYEQAFATRRPVMKLGRGIGSDGKPYPGGWVWRTVDDARRFLAEQGLEATHGVYGILADWDRDAELLPGDQTKRLIRDAEVVRLT